MHRAIAKKWVAALTSGKFKQARGILANTNDNNEPKSFCCLGVLTTVYCKEKKIPLHEYTDWSCGLLAENVRKWAGLYSSSGIYTGSRGCNRDLTDDNDKAKRSFKKIAEIIQNHVEEL
ncbi:MAG: hypothetical protein ACYC9R_05940 [Nitrosotalea sp.]